MEVRECKCCMRKWKEEMWGTRGIEKGKKRSPGRRQLDGVLLFFQTSMFDQFPYALHT